MLCLLSAERQNKCFYICMDRELNKMEEFPKFPQPQEQYIKIDG